MADTNPLIPKPGQPYDLIRNPNLGQPTDPPTTADRPSAGTSITNVVGGAADAVSTLGLTGWIKQFAQFGIIGIFMAVFLWLFQITIRDGRTDRIEDRQMFRDAVRDLQTEDNRRTGEIKGALDFNSKVMQELIAEIRAARHGGQLQERGDLPKAVKPPEENQS